MNRFFTRTIIICLLMLSTCVSIALADITTPFEYVTIHNFSASKISDGPEWSTCYMIETDEYSGIAFSNDGEGIWLTGVENISRDSFDRGILHQLFYNLVSNYDWDVSFYYPNGTDSMIEISYGLKKDIDKSKDNYINKDDYLTSLAPKLGLNGYNPISHNSVEPDSTQTLPTDVFLTKSIKFTVHGPYLFHASQGDYVIVPVDWVNIQNEPLYFHYTLSIEAFQSGHSVSNVLPYDLYSTSQKYKKGYGAMNFLAAKIEDENAEMELSIDRWMDTNKSFNAIKLTVRPYNLPVYNF